MQQLGLPTTSLRADSDRNTGSATCRAQDSSKCVHSLMCMLPFTHAVLSTPPTVRYPFTHVVLSTAPTMQYSLTVRGDPCSWHAQGWVQS